MPTPDEELEEIAVQLAQCEDLDTDTARWFVGRIQELCDAKLAMVVGEIESLRRLYNPDADCNEDLSDYNTAILEGGAEALDRLLSFIAALDNDGSGEGE